jgi:uncharacterized protein (TIGR02246 family)
MYSRQCNLGSNMRATCQSIKIKSLICTVLFLLNCTLTPNLPVEARANSSDAATFDKLFADWTQAFNRKDLKATVSLFSKDCVSSNPGAPHKDYAAICGLFKSLFGQTEKTYQYRYKIQNVYRSGDLATVRITWYLDITKDGKLLAKSEEQGIDIFQKNDKGVWQIVNFIAYSEDLKL